MNNNVKKWVAALESGKYKHTTEMLQDDCGYCCLGVAIRVYEEEMGLEHRDMIDDRVKDETLSYYPAVKEWLGLQGDTGQFNGGDLACINDRNVNFDEVIKTIKSNPKGLFVKD